MDLAKNIKKGDLFMTITLKPDMYKMRARRQYNRTIQSVKDILNVFCERYILIPELTEACNVHYHAIVSFKPQELVQFAKDKFIDVIRIHRVLGNTKINKMPVIDVKRTVDYMLKEYNKTKAIILNAKEMDENIYHVKQEIVREVDIKKVEPAPAGITRIIAHSPDKHNIKINLLDIDID